MSSVAGVQRRRGLLGALVTIATTDNRSDEIMNFRRLYFELVGGEVVEEDLAVFGFCAVYRPLGSRLDRDNPIAMLHMSDNDKWAGVTGRSNLRGRGRFRGRGLLYLSTGAQSDREEEHRQDS